MVTARRVLVLGGARSGKTREAERLALQSGLEVVVIATAEAGDAEMAERIGRHRQDRPANWQTIECPQDLADAIRLHARDGRVLVIDCLTLWLSNIIHAGLNPDIETERLVTAVKNSLGFIVLVSNETGLGIVPETPLGRSFRDCQGRLNSRIGDVADVMVFMLSGLPLRLKPVPESARIQLG